MVAVVGPSGSGKTTILNMITGIDRPTAGTVTVDGQRLDEMSEEQLAVWRGANVGIVFQFFQLLPTLSALENAVLPLDFARRGSKRERFERARHNLELVGLGDKVDHLPAELSGGEQQRVAIARSLAADPKLIVGRRADRQPRHGHRGRDVRAARAAERRGQDGPLRDARPRAGGAAPTASSRSATASSSRLRSAMVSASLRKSITDLTRRRARTVFTVATLALAVASISLLRDPDADRPLDAGGGARRSARGRDGVDATAGAHRRAARRAGGAAERRRGRAAHQRRRRGCSWASGALRRASSACATSRASRSTSSASSPGRLPAPARSLVDVQDANVGLYDGGTGDTVTVVGAGRRGAGELRLPVSGEARNIPGGEQVQDDDVIVLYATADTVAALSGERGLRPARVPARATRARAAAARRSRRCAATCARCPASPASRTCRRCARPATGRARRRPSSSPSS